jgi:hypothetical protein
LGIIEQKSPDLAIGAGQVWWPRHRWPSL